MNIAVIVVNYGTPELAISAVNSVLTRDHGGHGVEIHLVDNASPGEDAAAFQTAHETGNWGDRVRLWLESENHGFGRGNNRVLEMLEARDTPPDYVFLLNPDAELENEAIAILVDALEANPQAGAAGAGISFPDGRPAVACFRFPSLTSEVLSAINFGPLDKLFHKSRVSLPPEYDGDTVDWVAGASVLMRFETLRKVGFFDPDFFLYFEEVELMRRLARAGHPTLYVPEARVVHIAGAATNVSSEDKQPKPRPAFLYDSWKMYFTKTHGRGYALVTALMKLPAAALGTVLSRLRGRRPEHLPTQFFKDHWTHVVRPLISGGGASVPASEAAGDLPEDINDGTQNRNPDDIGFWALVAEDFRTHERNLFAQGFWALFWHRFGNWRMSIKTRPLRVPLSILYRMGAKQCEWWGGILLPYTVVVGRRVKLEHFGGMILVANQIGNDVIIRQNTTFGIANLDDRTGRPVIGDGVQVGAGVVAVGRIHIGAGTVIGANAVVTKDLPPGVVAGGVPAKVLTKKPPVLETVLPLKETSGG